MRENYDYTGNLKRSFVNTKLGNSCSMIKKYLEENNTVYED